MKPIDPAGAEGEHVVYGASQPEYAPLPAVKATGPFGEMILTRWQLSEEERKAVIAGADIELLVTTFGQPLQPVSLLVAGFDYEGRLARGINDGL